MFKCNPGDCRPSRSRSVGRSRSVCGLVGLVGHDQSIEVLGEELVNGGKRKPLANDGKLGGDLDRSKWGAGWRWEE